MKDVLKLGAAFVAGVVVTALFLRVSSMPQQSAPAQRAEAMRSAETIVQSEAPIPARVPTLSSAPASPTAPATVEQIQQAQITALQARVRDLERKAAAARPTSDRDAGSVVPDSKVHGFTDAELQAMAQNCEIRFDLPHISRDPFQLSPDQGARLHLSDADQKQVSAAVTRASADVLAHLRAFYIEATGDAAGADSLDPGSLMQEILQKAPRDSEVAARAEIARERAGFPSQPTATPRLGDGTVEGLFTGAPGAAERIRGMIRQRRVETLKDGAHEAGKGLAHEEGGAPAQGREDIALRVGQAQQQALEAEPAQVISHAALGVALGAGVEEGADALAQRAIGDAHRRGGEGAQGSEEGHGAWIAPAQGGGALTIVHRGEHDALDGLGGDGAVLMRRWKSNCTRSGRPTSRLSRITSSKNSRPCSERSKTWVRLASIWRIESW